MTTKAYSVSRTIRGVLTAVGVLAAADPVPGLSDWRRNSGATR